MNFAKLYTYPEGQLLVTLDTNYETDEMELVCRSDKKELTLKTTGSFDDEEAARAAFNKFDEVIAKETFDGMSKMMGR